MITVALRSALPWVVALISWLPAGKVYLVLGSDTAIWEGMNVGQYTNHFATDLYLDPNRNAARVMDPLFRNSLVDSYGQPLKLTWWMMGGNIFRRADNRDVPCPNTMTLYLMHHEYSTPITEYGDELSLHYHTFVWSDTDGDGVYWWNQAGRFRDSAADWLITLGNYLLEEEVFPVSFRSGWHYMDNDWQAELNRWIPFSMHNDWPHVHLDTEEPLDNNYDWSRAPASFVPFQPAPDDYQLPGGHRGWNLRSAHFSRVRYLDLMDTLFIRAEQGEDQVACFWGHLPEADFLDNLVILDSLAHQAQAEHPTVDFRYCTAVEAMQRWLGTTDSLAPNLSLTWDTTAASVTFRCLSDEPLFQAQPFFAWKDRYEITHIDTLWTPLTGLSWEITLPVPLTAIGKVGLAATDTVGNQRIWIQRFLPDDDYRDNRDAGYEELAGDWTDLETAAWGRDSRQCLVDPGDTAGVRWSIDLSAPGTYS
ncbi:MAG: hypothetical protein D6762_08910, partial [Candidatus Neomarinimicrobiota bacterium]